MHSGMVLKRAGLMRHQRAQNGFPRHSVRVLKRVLLMRHQRGKARACSPLLTAATVSILEREPFSWSRAPRARATHKASSDSIATEPIGTQSRSVISTVHLLPSQVWAVNICARYTCICVCLCICVYALICAFGRVYAHVRVYAYMRVYACICVHMHVCA